MTQIQQIRQQLTELRSQVNQGEIFQSLGDEVGKIIESVKKDRSTKVYLNDDESDFLDMIADLRSQLNDHELKAITNEELLALLGHIGSTNTAVRDQGVYFLFNDLLEDQVLTKKQMTQTFNYLLSDEVMFDHINERKNNGIFQRSFAVLLISSLLYGDRAGYFFLNKDMLSRLVDQIAIYIILETDTRGFIKRNGWAHAYTHIGNVLDELSQRDDLARSDKIFLMTVLIERYKRLETPLIFGEPQRISAYLSRLTQTNHLYSSYFLLQLKAWRSDMMSNYQPQSEGQWNTIFNNVRLMQAILINGNFDDEIVKYIASGQNFMS
ncbi:DUF2785 domain-containing protein [Paucilactobacillus suebicus]|uniref:DUF2785 domain-containing protein n=1 Tax=Paucilactobacillus suebicus DSM 5007 = KCTC 3549 TaxID=1423807 RepID=A0A0R1WD02_9LACO|nr:DUF2785 domain-containing protein [Paucilactobacillus suebicus]KRM13499.1 hypothetical protein FD16_GL000066 [Paucilactobacillus suebicus DSM 5007 = KCTC 3549]